MRRILLVDDEQVYSRLYVKALQLQGFMVTRSTGPRSAKALARDKQFDLFVFDLMMPAQGEFDRESTYDGMLTGACLARDIAELHPDVPIIIYTMMHDPNVIEAARNILMPTKKVLVLSKRELNPSEFAEAILTLFHLKAKPGLLRRFLDCIILQPNIFGFGIDLQSVRKLFSGKDS
jgi:DNA-binding NarL/FixJ family response regulator